MYLVFKWLHILSIISWMAGILYLWRIFVNHRDQGFEDQNVNKLLIGMGDRLYRFITLPAMISSWVFGLGMAFLNHSFFMSGWLWLKIIAVALLTHVTIKARKYWVRFSESDTLLPSGKVFRFLNEVPTILMMIAVGLVVFKPF